MTIIQYKQPIKYLSIPKDTTVSNLHYEIANIVDCTAGIRDVMFANDNNMLNMIRLPMSVGALPIYEFLTINKHCLDISFHYRHGFTMDIFIMDDVCIENFINNHKKEVELTSAYKEINENARKTYVNNIIQKISA